jgi:Flp pilus assembly protein TadG
MLAGRRTDGQRERGAAAVEFALVLLPLALLVFGIIEFGLLLNKQISVANGAREAARYAAIHYAEPDVVDVAEARAAATAGFLTGTESTVDVSACSPGSLGYATARVQVDPDFVTGWFIDMFDPAYKVTGNGRMVCGG